MAVLAESLEIAEACAADTAAIVSLWERAGLTRPWNDPARDVEMSLSAANSVIFLVRGEDALIGTVMAGYDGHRGWVYYLAVEPERRGFGIGKRLYRAAEAWLAAAGAPKIQILIRAENGDAASFYERLGFEKSASFLMGKALPSLAKA